MKHSFLALALLAGCASDELSRTTSNLDTENGQNLNGQNLNGQNLNGQNLNGPGNGLFAIWTSLQGAVLQGKAFDSVTLNGTVFTGIKGSSTVTGLDMVETQFTSMRGDGTTVLFRIRSIVAPPAGSDEWLYYVDYRETDGNWYPICRDANGVEHAASPLNGIWDHRQGVAGGGSHIADATKFTFACQGMGAIAKCVDDGYKPWASVNGVSLWNHHEACVRLLRGDYCGDGTPYTQNGNRVNLYDHVGIQQVTENWFFEAEWDQDGARCFSPLNRSHAGIPCYNPRVTLGCGSQQDWALGTLLIDETPTAGLTP
jgi:hypothetical protein